MASLLDQKERVRKRLSLNLLTEKTLLFQRAVYSAISTLEKSRVREEVGEELQGAHSASLFLEKPSYPKRVIGAES